MKRAGAVPFLALIDVFLLAVIVFSMATGRSAGSGSGDNGDIVIPVTAAERETASQPQPATEDQQEPVSQPPSEAEAQSETQPQPGLQQKAKPPTETQSKSEQQSASQPQPEPTLESNVSAYDTTERPTLADFTWVTQDVLVGAGLTGGEPIPFSGLLGGWKCYLIDIPGEGQMVERFLNVDISGTEENVTLTLDWYYIYLGDEDRGYDEDAPDSVFAGKKNADGTITAVGPGTLTIRQCVSMDGHQYAVGSLMWPDGIVSHVALARP